MYADAAFQQRQDVDDLRARRAVGDRPARPAAHTPCGRHLRD